jgi:amino acid permease
MIIGTGVFNLPYAFYNAGIVLSVVLLVISAFFSWLCLVWFLEVSARAEGICAYREQQSSSDPIHQIGWRKFELTHLCNDFFGFKGKIVSQLSLCLYCYGLLWAYAAVFASSVDSLYYQFVFRETCDIEVPANWGHNCQIGYYCCLVVYACFVVPLSCMNVGEQAAVQVLLTMYRFLAFGVMFVTVLFGLCYSPNPFSSDPNSHVSDPGYVKWGGFAGIFTTAAVALNFHFTIPDIIKPVRNKEYLREMTSSALVVATTFYLLMGILCSLYFGPHSRSLATLNWQSYTGHLGGWGGPFYTRPWWAVVVQLLVMLFPIFDMMSVFPLVAVSLGDNLLQFVPEHNLFSCCPGYTSMTVKKQKKATQIFFFVYFPVSHLYSLLLELDNYIKYLSLLDYFLSSYVLCSPPCYI